MRGRDRLFIGGDWVAPAGADVLTVVSPYTERPVGRVPMATTTDIDRAVIAARNAFELGPWPRLTLDERRAILARVGALLDPMETELSALVSTELTALLVPSSSLQRCCSICQFRSCCQNDRLEMLTIRASGANATRHPVNSR